MPASTGARGAGRSYTSLARRISSGEAAMNGQVLAAIRRRLAERGLDAYVAYTPSNVFYATGFQSYFLMQWWRMQGTLLAVIPADEGVGVGMMIGDFEAGPARKVSGIDDVRSYRLWPEIRDAAAVRDPLAPGELEEG